MAVNRVKVATTTTGTADFGLGSAVSEAFQDFADAGIPDQATVMYSAFVTGQFECGVGIYDSASLELSRDTIYNSSSGGTKVSFTSSPTIIMGPLQMPLPGFVTPEVFGAVGDGAADDTDAVQAAFDFGSDVYLPGTYYLTNTITLLSPIANRTIRGRGKYSTTFVSDQEITFIELDSTNGFGMALVEVADIGFRSTADLVAGEIQSGICGIKIIPTDTKAFFTHNTLKDLSFILFADGILFDAGSSIGSLMSWTQLRSMDFISCNKGIRHKQGSTTGLLIADITAVLFGSNAVVIEQGDGVQDTGDVVIKGLQAGGVGTGILMRGGSATPYGTHVSIGACDFDAGIINAFDLRGMGNVRIAPDVLLGGGVGWSIDRDCTNIDFPLPLTVTPVQLTGNENDYNPTDLARAKRLLLSSDASRSITGIAGGFDGRELELINIGASNITLEHNDSGSSGENRFAINTDAVIAPQIGILLAYMGGSTNKWVRRSGPIGLAVGPRAGEIF